MCTIFYLTELNNFEDLTKAYLSHGSDITNFIELKTHNEMAQNEELGIKKRKRKYTMDTEVKTEKPIEDMQMELCDRIPQIDRPNFSITNIVDIIPRLLFKREDLKVEKSVNTSRLTSFTSTYLNSCGEYAYITGLLIYEDLSLAYEAHQEMDYYKKEKFENGKQNLGKRTLDSNGREGTSTTKDDTFTSVNFGQPKFNRVTLSSVSEEDQIYSSRGNTITSKNHSKRGISSIEKSSGLEEEKEGLINFSEQIFLSENEAIKNSSNLSNASSTPFDSEPMESNLSEERNTLNSNVKRSETIGKKKVPRNKIKLPKLIVLVSKYPIYKDMEKFLKKLERHCFNCTSIPLESLVMNLVYEFPHPGYKYIVKSNFWGYKEKNKFEYETVNSLPF